MNKTLTILEIMNALDEAKTEDELTCGRRTLTRNGDKTIGRERYAKDKDFHKFCDSNATKWTNYLNNPTVWLKYTRIAADVKNYDHKRNKALQAQETGFARFYGRDIPHKLPYANENEER